MAKYGDNHNYGSHHISQPDKPWESAEPSFYSSIRPWMIAQAAPPAQVKYAKRYGPLLASMMTLCGCASQATRGASWRRFVGSNLWWLVGRSIPALEVRTGEFAAVCQRGWQQWGTSLVDQRICGSLLAARRRFLSCCGGSSSLLDNWRETSFDDSSVITHNVYYVKYRLCVDGSSTVRAAVRLPQIGILFRINPYPFLQ